MHAFQAMTKEDRFRAPDVDALYSAAAIAGGHHADKACLWLPAFGCAVLQVHSDAGCHRLDVVHLHMVGLDSWKFEAPHG